MVNLMPGAYFQVLSARSENFLDIIENSYNVISLLNLFFFFLSLSLSLSPLHLHNYDGMHFFLFRPLLKQLN